MALAKQTAPRIAVAWFLGEDWDEIKRLCVDELHDSYDDWLTDARGVLITTAAEGYSPEQVILRPADIRERERATRRKGQWQGAVGDGDGEAWEDGSWRGGKVAVVVRVASNCSVAIDVAPAFPLSSLPPSG